MLTMRHRHSRRWLLALGLCGFGGCSSHGELEPVFCYRTLADVSCYVEPDPGRTGQLVGVYLRDPEDETSKDYWLRESEARMSR
jgi:hypothetical protein